VAIQALESRIENRLNLDGSTITRKEDASGLPLAPKLELKQTDFPKDNEVRKTWINKKIQVYLGIDIGSTTTKHALISEDRQIIHKQYVHTQGKPVEVTQNLIRAIRDELGDRIHIVGTATTGSGRNVVGDFLNVDLIIDEITAHARGAVEIEASIDTIFEIGGQDSKYIYIANTYPLDFDMNKVCAAGNGEFSPRTCEQVWHQYCRRISGNCPLVGSSHKTGRAMHCLYGIRSGFLPSARRI
jgi:activator of 2-hydroxyglutaryl-CoA dehydratase